MKVSGATQQVRPEPHNLLSAMETWKRTDHTNTQDAPQTQSFTQVGEKKN